MINVKRISNIFIAVICLSSASAHAAGNTAKGAQVFVKCQACHKIDGSGKSGAGPNLNKVTGRKAGSLSGFKFSPAMTNSDVVWSDATLSEFLAAPAKRIPGNRMAFAGLSKPSDRDDVIAYIRSASK